MVEKLFSKLGILSNFHNQITTKTQQNRKSQGKHHNLQQNKVRFINWHIVGTQ